MTQVESMFKRGILSLPEAACAAGYSPTTFRRWARSGQSPFRIVRPDGDRYWRADGGSFSDWLAQRKGGDPTPTTPAL
jgi:predicted lipoprotein with Yx(FWY)xxD motif